MENVRAERSAGWSVLCYVGVLAIASLLTSPLPPVTLGPGDLAPLIDAHRTVVLASAWLAFPAAGFFLWFLVGLRHYLRQAPGRPEGLPTFAMIAGVVMVAGSLFAASLETAFGYVPPDAFASSGMESIYTTFVFIQGGLGYAPVAIFLFACAHSMRRHDSAPAWLAWLGYAAAAGAGLATLSIFFIDPFMSPTGLGPGLFGALPAAVWLVSTGVILVRTKGASEGTPAPAV